jgi:hypothetical protein
MLWLPAHAFSSLFPVLAWLGSFLPAPVGGGGVPWTPGVSAWASMQAWLTLDVRNMLKEQTQRHVSVTEAKL